jgi:DNA-binding LacI/PurR family transcriptional regulator
MAASFAFSFPAKMLALIKNSLQPGEAVDQYPTIGMPDNERRRLQTLLAQTRPIGLIGICIRPDPAIVAAYRSARIPVVLIDEEMEGAATVTTDNYEGGYIAGNHLVSGGRRNIAVVSGRVNVQGGYNAAQRLLGFTSALSSHGTLFNKQNLVEVTDYSYSDGAKAMKRLLDERPGFDAVFSAAGDECAVGILKSARERGVAIPKEVAVVGYDDIEIAKSASPPLTTIRQPLQEMAAAAYRMVTSAAAETLAKPMRTLFRPELVVRESG